MAPVYLSGEGVCDLAGQGDLLLQREGRRQCHHDEPRQPSVYSFTAIRRTPVRAAHCPAHNRSAALRPCWHVPGFGVQHGISMFGVRSNPCDVVHAGLRGTTSRGFRERRHRDVIHSSGHHFLPCGDILDFSD